MKKGNLQELFLLTMKKKCPETFAIENATFYKTRINV
jgi:hypothetical protein